MNSNNLKLIATVNLDFYTNNIKTINVKQYDSKSRYIQVSFTEHGKKVELNKGTLSVIARYKKSDGKFGLQDCEILDDGTVMIQTTEQMLAVPGRCRLDVVILESNGLNVENFCDVRSFDDIDCAILSTMPLDLNVIACPVNDGELQSEYDFTDLNESLAAIKAAGADMIAKNEEWTEAEGARAEAEELRNIAENGQFDESGNLIKKGRVQTEQERIQAEQKRVDAEEKRTEAIENAIKECSEKADYATAEAQKCENIYGECEAAKDRANLAAQNCEGIVSGVQPDWEADELSVNAIKNKPPIEKGDGQNSLQGENNIAIGGNSVAFGKGSIAGCKGFYIKSIDMTNKRIYLSVDQVLPPTVSENDTPDTSFATPAFVDGDKFNIVNGSHYTYCGTIKSVENNVIEYYEDSLGFTEFANDSGQDAYVLNVPTKPTIGLVDVGQYAHAEGQGAISAGIAGHAEGRDTTVIDNYGHTEGRQTMAGYAAHAEGMRSEALGLYSHAEGFNARSKGNTSHAEGYDTEAQGDYSHTEGYQTKSIGEQSHAEGSSSESVGKGSHAEGHGTHSIGEYSHSEGQESSSSGKGSHAEGLNTLSQGEYSHAEGNTTRSVGNHSHSEGEATHAEGQASHAEGYHARATKLGAHAEGVGTISEGQASHSEGNSTEATADYAHAEGCDTVASAQAAHAEGYGCEATGLRSHAEGLHSKAVGQVSHAEGYGVIANGNNQHVQGKYNIEDTEGKYAHIVGNGSAEDVVDESGNITKRNRSNAHTLDWNGNAWYKTLSLGGTFDNPMVEMKYDETKGRFIISVN